MSPLVYVLLAIVAVGAAGFALVPAMFGSRRADADDHQKRKDQR